MPFIDTRSGTSPFYRDWGTGRPVVFYSAWGMDSTEPRTVMADLVAHGYRAIAVDRRGHGRSDDPGHGYDYDTLADDLSDVLDELNVHGATMVGYSMGGGEIVRYLTRHGSARVDRIALVAAALPFLMRTTDNPHGVPVEAADALRDSRRHGLDTWLLDNADPYIGAGLPGCEVSQATRDRVLTLILGTSPHAAIECNRAVVETDFRAELPRITVPVLIVHGDTDASVSLELGGRKQAVLIPGSELVVYENVPHALYLTHGPRLAADLLAFLGNSPSGSAHHDHGLAAGVTGR
ncbi:alpha/beta fold hydrolase [Nocardia seriolae]|uniref:Chloride peroxidase n=1 Tax=Nocardia seriolae TaxID=37332 RepID=A0A0B8MZL6_9NOCA|nr:alpha/beta hydrolase [Nocardia seriolae]APA99318.1 Chloride peroxidase [Nocardia seriolae]MTJ63292.1 alpha/beta fold hydrolase [Nocardia seriolae]MTJ71167.1 alpha/beta fold hydrolase [Nocardia seriolae]MTJ88908.1 alpha/beta fold hydrolase [Nocardia seriolae]MTK32887.1 alpha/beta fold hydrolase [Nocardia seriolae]